MTILLSRLQAAEELGISLTTFEEQVQPHLPHARIGRRVLFFPADLVAWSEAQRVEVPVDSKRRREVRVIKAAPGTLPSRGKETRAQLLKKLSGGK